MNITLTEAQIDFLQRAIELRKSVIDFDIESEEFKSVYGLSQEEYEEEIKRLSLQL